MNYNKNPLQASLLVALSGILYGFLGYLGTKLIETDLSISMMLFWRFTIAGLWMLIFCVRSHCKTQSFSKVNKRALCYMFVIGAIGYTGSSGFFFVASEYTGTGLAMVIFFSYPIAIALYSCLMHKKVLKLGTVCTLVAITTGLFLLRDSSNHPISLLGIFFGLLSSITYAFYVIGCKRFSSLNMDSAILTTVVCFSCSVVFLVLALFNHSLAFPSSLKAWIYILGLGIFVTAIPIQLMLEGLKRISSLRASIISVLEPLVTVLVGVLLLNESISTIQMVGVIILLGSTLLIQFQKEL